MSVNATIIFCDDIQNTIINGQMTPSISNPIGFIKPYAIPGNFSFAVFCVIDNLPINSIHNIRVKVYDVMGEIVMDSDIINVTKKMAIVGDYYAPLNLSVDFRNLIIQKEGEIKVEVFVDDLDKPLTSKSIKVIKDI